MHGGPYHPATQPPLILSATSSARTSTNAIRTNLMMTGVKPSGEPGTLNSHPAGAMKLHAGWLLYGLLWAETGHSAWLRYSDELSPAR